MLTGYFYVASIGGEVGQQVARFGDTQWVLQFMLESKTRFGLPPGFDKISHVLGDAGKMAADRGPQSVRFPF